MANEQSFLVKFALGLWHFINGSRKVFLNLLFLLFMYMLYVALMQPAETLRLKSETTLVIRPYGNVVEQYTSTPMDRALQEATGQDRSETRLRDMLEAIHRAAGDSDIKQLVIDPSYMWGIGLAALKDIGHAVDAFRTTGKPVIAVADYMGQHQYYLASLADEIWLNPNGTVWIDGYSSYRHYYREGLEKLEVEINLFRVGEYKSAMEPFIRDDMSPAAEKAGKFWLGNLWQQYLEDVSAHRGMLLENLQDAIDNLPDRIEDVDGDFARYALDLGLVDRLLTGPESRQELAKLGTPDKAGDSYRAAVTCCGHTAGLVALSSTDELQRTGGVPGSAAPHLTAHGPGLLSADSARPSDFHWPLLAATDWLAARFQFQCTGDWIFYLLTTVCGTAPAVRFCASSRRPIAGSRDTRGTSPGPVSLGGATPVQTQFYHCSKSGFRPHNW